MNVLNDTMVKVANSLYLDSFVKLTTQGSASHAVLEGWPDEEKRQFITWRTTILATAQKRSWKQRLQLPAMVCVYISILFLFVG